MCQQRASDRVPECHFAPTPSPLTTPPSMLLRLCLPPARGIAISPCRKTKRKYSDVPSPTSDTSSGPFYRDHRDPEVYLARPRPARFQVPDDQASLASSSTHGCEFPRTRYSLLVSSGRPRSTHGTIRGVGGGTGRGGGGQPPGSCGTDTDEEVVLQKMQGYMSGVKAGAELAERHARGLVQARTRMSRRRDRAA